MPSTKITPSLSIVARTSSSEDVITRPIPVVHSSRFSFPYTDVSTPTLTPNSASTSYIEKTPKPEQDETSSTKHRTEDLARLVSQVDEKPTFSDPDGRMLKRSKNVMTVVKILVMGSLLSFK